MLKILSQFAAEDLRENIAGSRSGSGGDSATGSAAAAAGSAIATQAADVANEFNLILAWIIQATDYGWPQSGELAQRVKSLRPAVRSALSRPRSCRCDNCSNAVCEDDGDENADLVNRIVREYLGELDLLIMDLESVRQKPVSWLDAFGRFERLATRFPEVRGLVSGIN